MIFNDKQKEEILKHENTYDERYLQRVIYNAGYCQACFSLHSLVLALSQIHHGGMILRGSPTGHRRHR